jgi:hypothetical protein
MASLPNGQIYPGAPALHPGFTQNVEGGLLKAATTSTLTQQATNAAAVRGLGAGQKGARRRTKRRKLRGGANVAPLAIPTANSIKGVHPENNQIKGVDALNRIKVGAMYDDLGSSPPYLVGGFRMRGPDDEELTGGRKRRRKTKKHGRSHKRTHRRSHRKSAHRRGRGSRRI